MEHANVWLQMAHEQEYRESNNKLKMINTLVYIEHLFMVNFFPKEIQLGSEAKKVPKFCGKANYYICIFFIAGVYEAY